MIAQDIRKPIGLNVLYFKLQRHISLKGSLSEKPIISQAATDKQGNSW